MEVNARGNGQYGFVHPGVGALRPTDMRINGVDSTVFLCVMSSAAVYFQPTTTVPVGEWPQRAYLQWPQIGTYRLAVDQANEWWWSQAVVTPKQYERVEQQASGKIEVVLSLTFDDPGAGA